MDTLKHPIYLFPARALSVLEAALFYLERKISIIPVSGKKPAGWSWAENQIRRPAFSHVHNWHHSGFLTGVGIVCGAVSQNLVVIDLDGEDSVDEFQRAFPRLFDTYVVLSGSGKGRHLYFYVDDLPSTTRTKGFELRANGCYVVAPPSKHPDTHAAYMGLNEMPVARLTHMRDVIEWIKPKMPQPVLPAASPAVERPTPNFNTDYERNARQYYFNRALEGEIARVERSSEGTRNDNLNMAAFCMGGLILTALERGRVEDALLEAALSVGSPELESRRTIQSGLNAGLKKPRRYPGAK